MRIDLLESVCPWATETCTAPLLVVAIPCALVAQTAGSAECAPVSDEHPLHTTSHFLSGTTVPESDVSGGASNIGTLYASLGVAVTQTILDGDCALDVMTMMLGLPHTLQARSDLRTEISDYLLA